LSEERDRLENEIRQAGKAKEVLEHEAFKAAVQQVEEALLGGMRAAAITDDKMRLRLLDKYEALHALLGVLQGMVDSGLMAAEELRQKSVAERIKQFLVVN
jgi:hypothetical protein